MTFFHKLDPRTKLLATIIIGVQILLYHDALRLSAFTAGITLILVAAHLFTLHLMRRMFATLWILIFIIFVNAFTIPGEVLGELFGLHATIDGLARGLLLSWRFILLVVASHLLVTTTPPSQLVDVIEGLTRIAPRALRPLVESLTLSISYAPLLFRMANQMRSARAIRGCNTYTSLSGRSSALLKATTIFFSSAFHASREVSQAMDARCYDVRGKRTTFRKLAFSQRDRVALIMLTLFSILIGALENNHHP